MLDQVAPGIALIASAPLLETDNTPSLDHVAPGVALIALMALAVMFPPKGAR